jgi:hypothetical protein
MTGPRFDQQRPALTIDRGVTDVWTGVASNHPIVLRNTGTTVARRIAISVDGRARCRFAEVNDLAAGRTVTIEPVWHGEIVQHRIRVGRGTLTGIRRIPGSVSIA